MPPSKDLRSLPDEALLRDLIGLVAQSLRCEADLVAHIGEVDARRLYARQACTSMHVYCVEVLRLTDFEAYMRIGAARASRKYPMLLAMLRDGRLHVTAIARLSPHLTRENWKDVLKRATHRTKREIEELIAELNPKPDVPTRIRKVPVRQPKVQSQLVPERVAALNSKKGKVLAEPSRRNKPPRIEALAPDRYDVQFTASAGLRAKLDRLKTLMRSSIPDGDLAALIEAAVTEKIERLEARKLGRTKAPRKTLAQTDTRPSSRHIPAPVRRVVHERDGGRCTYQDTRGRRCRTRERLEFHHVDPYGQGGAHSPENIRLLCRTHNQLQAELDYGAETMDRYRRPDRVSEHAPPYGAPAPADFVTPPPVCYDHRSPPSPRAAPSVAGVAQW